MTRLGWDADLAPDFLACQVLMLQVALHDLLLGCQHDCSDPHPKLLKHMLRPHHLRFTLRCCNMTSACCSLGKHAMQTLYHEPGHVAVEAMTMLAQVSRAATSQLPAFAFNMFN